MATNTPKSGCINTGVTLGSSSAFDEETNDSIQLVSASSSASVGCYWDITGIDLSQQIPAAQPVGSGSYSLDMTITITPL